MSAENTDVAGLRLTACAKINLGLRVLGRREDGYHDIITIFQRISLADELELEPTAGEVIYEGPQLTDDPADNLCCRAAQAFRSGLDLGAGVRIRLVKRIPSGAGLGGGSSDAAAVLTGMARIAGIAVGDPRLARAAVSVGADVPFFLLGVKAALGTGRGELLQPRWGLSPGDRVLIVWSGIILSTSAAYSKLDSDLTFEDGDINIIGCQFSTYQGGSPTAMMTNDFEGPAFAAHPELIDIRDRMLAAGARFAGLCGSGSALFGVFDGEAQAEAAARGWRSSWLSFVCRPC